MGDIGLILSLPTDSIAVRAAVASTVAVLLAHVLLRGRLRSARARAVTALLPAVAIVLVVLASARSASLPLLWRTVDAPGGLTLAVRDTYLSFAPVAVTLVLAAWALVAVVRLAARGTIARRVTRQLRVAIAAGDEPPRSVQRTVAVLAAALQVGEPRTVVVESLAGGAVVLGVRRPVLLLDRDLLERLDDDELEGVVAHELAHVLRRDNLVATSLRVLRDVVFFVPGAGRSLRWLLREREHAADAAAVALTGRPGALASGLLKVLEGAQTRTAAACSPLLAQGTLVGRVQELCDERPAPTRTRLLAEWTVVSSALLLALGAAVLVPDAAAGSAGERDALGLLLSDVAVTEASAVEVRPAVFAAFDDAGSTASLTSAVEAPAAAAGGTLLSLDDPYESSVGRLAACEQDPSLCPLRATDRTVPMRPPARVLSAEHLVDRWRLAPLVRSDSQEVGVFLFQRISDPR